MSAQFRKTFYPSGAKDDGRDAELLLDLVLQHRRRLRCWAPDTEQTRWVQNLVEERRKLVNDKTAILNSLTARLKLYFPQMLEWFDPLGTYWCAICWIAGRRWSSCRRCRSAACGSSFIVIIAGRQS